MRPPMSCASSPSRPSKRRSVQLSEHAATSLPPKSSSCCMSRILSAQDSPPPRMSDSGERRRLRRVLPSLFPLAGFVTPCLAQEVSKLVSNCLASLQRTSTSPRLCTLASNLAINQALSRTAWRPRASAGPRDGRRRVVERQVCLVVRCLISRWVGFVAELIEFDGFLD